VGALVTTSPAPGSAVLDLPWIITIGPFGDDEDWEPVVCGPYERLQALALARAVVENDDLMAVVEPVQPFLTADRIKRDVAVARATASEDALAGDFEETLPATARGAGIGMERVALDDAADVLPQPEEVREGFVRLAERLAALDLR
jgi:hypothetical protein